MSPKHVPTKSVDPHRALKRVIVLGVLSFVFALVWSVDEATEFREGRGPRATSAVGFGALTAYVRSLGVEVTEADVSRMRFPDERRWAVVADPEPNGTVVSELDSVFNRSTVVLIVLPKWDAQTTTDDHVSRVSILAESAVESVLEEFIALEVIRVSPLEETSWSLPYDGIGPHLSTATQRVASHPSITPIVSAADGSVVLGQLDWDVVGAWTKDVYLLTDPDILANHGLHRPGNAELAQWIFTEMREVPDSLVYIEQVEGTNLVAILAAYPLNLLTMTVILVALLALWAGVVRFGDVRSEPRPLGEGHEPLIASTAQLLLNAGHGRHSLGRYFAMVREQVLRTLHAPSDLPADAVASWLAHVERSRRVTVCHADLVLQVNSATDDRHFIEVAASIHRWSTELRTDMNVRRRT